MAAFVVKAKKGAIVRAACALASEKVDALACGTAVTVAETVETNGGLRCRLAAPGAGWGSLKVPLCLSTRGLFVRREVDGYDR